MSNSIKQQLQWAVEQIKSETSRLDAELLLTKVLGSSRSYLFTWPEKLLTPDQMQKYQAIVQERVLGKPIAYILGVQEFWSLNLKVTADTLIPRPETEQMVEAILQQNQHRENLQVVDAGTGTGAIALALKKEQSSWNISACDCSELALAVAQSNALTHNLGVRFFKNNWLENIASECFDIVVSNPPYIADGDRHLQALQFEPTSALVAQDNGLADIKIIVAQAKNVLKTNGLLYIEHGYNQAQEVKEIFQQHGFSNVVTEKDFAGNDRFTVGLKSHE